ncbi:MAG: hypothetical protein ACOZCO_05885 [Bacteroidota bacterium]
MKTLFFTVIFCLAAGISGAQQSQSASQQQVVKEPEDFDGTYQVMYTTYRTEIFPKEVRQIIESKRHQTDMVLWEYSEFTTFRILPYDIINSSGFTPFSKEETFIYIQGNK